MQAVGSVVYLPFVRDHVVQAQYFKAPFNLKSYFHKNPFLPDLNNEAAGGVNEQYRDNLSSLDNFVLARFDEDITGLPPLLYLVHCTCFYHTCVCRQF